MTLLYIANIFETHKDIPLCNCMSQIGPIYIVIFENNSTKIVMLNILYIISTLDTTSISYIGLSEYACNICLS